MYMVNFKKSIIAFLALSAVLLSGCQSETHDASSYFESNEISSENSKIHENETSDESSSISFENSDFSSEDTESDISDDTSKEDIIFYAGREYPDDELVPDSWIKIDARKDGLTKIKETVQADTSSADPEKAIPALVEKNRLIFEMIWASGSDFYTIDWDSPYESPEFFGPLYPISFTEYSFDTQSLNELVNDTFVESAAFNILHRPLEIEENGGEPLFVEMDGQMYVNLMTLPIWGFDPFICRSYIEITEKTDSKCTLIWHYADYEKLNPPESGFEFFYYNKTYTAEYIDGKWKLDKMIYNYNESD